MPTAIGVIGASAGRFGPRFLIAEYYYAEAGDEITKRLTEMFAQLASAGFQYPERVLSLVEIPLSLRTYGGGWRLDALRAPVVADAVRWRRVD